MDKKTYKLTPGYLKADPKLPRKLGWGIKCYTGSEVYLKSKIDGVSENKWVPVKKMATLRSGLKVVFDGIMGYEIGGLKKMSGKWVVDTGANIGLLEFNKDDRKCCTISGVINKRALKMWNMEI